MNVLRIKKVAACIMAAALVVAISPAGVNVHVNAADSSSGTVQSGEATQQGTPPAGGQPSGEPPSGEAPTGEPPTGEAPSGEPPTGEPPSGAPPSGGDMGGANTMTYDYTGTLSGALTADSTVVASNNETHTTSTAGQNTALVQNGGTLTINNGILTKSGDESDGDKSNFYGLNSILLAVNSDSIAYISDSQLSADSEGSNGIFATDTATVYANNNTITTESASSRGLDATYGGTILANLMTISTQGDHSASIATDRGGGTISVTNSTLSTAGSGSPLLYSTGAIQVDNVAGTSTGSQIAGMEGLNTILISNSELTSTNTSVTASDPIANGIIIYQSTSGDAESATGSTAIFEAVDSTLKSAITSGAMFYSTNTAVNIVLSNTTLDFDSSNVNLITVQGNDSNGWGTPGSNGSDVKFTGLGETLSGNIEVDTISSLDMYLLEETVYTGAAAISTNAVNTDQASAPITINVDSTSKWIVTGDSTVTHLNAENGASIVDEDGNTVSIVAAGTTIVDGTSAYTVTVTGSYSTTVTTDSGNQVTDSYIDRTSFDQYFGVNTTFGGNSAAAKQTETEAATPSPASETPVALASGNETNQTGLAQYGLIGALFIVLAGGLVFWYTKKRR